MASLPHITDILGNSTIAAVQAVNAATCELLDPRELSGEVALTKARPLSDVQVARLTQLLLDPQSWFFAKKRCLPSKTALFRLHGPAGSALLFVEFGCWSWDLRMGNERRWAFFDPVEQEIRGLLKAIFPEYASPRRRSLWRAGAIRELQRQRRMEAV